MLLRSMAPAMCFALVACGRAPAPEVAQFRGHDLEILHPAPYANYVSVAPGRQDAALPGPRQIRSRRFSRFLREKTGCVMDPSREMAVLGHKKMPAGYMVPVVCL
ncbi:MULTISPECIES: hypothetical protein [unclassified Roseovarius]|uniref:hypothetical protein n=1 Tax=unclassified Roseovarius TaxID=2614913 RepID=UPI00273F15AA|nr:MULTISPECIES: hypothetical protein [unclassified Roseovarius]